MEPPFQFDLKTMSILAAQQSVPAMHVGDEVWFCAKPCALLLGYKDTKHAIRDNVDEDWRMTLSNLLKRGGGPDPPRIPHTPNQLAATWISWSGLLELCTSSSLPMAKRFKKWVYGEVLPAVLKTGSYSISQTNTYLPDEWNQERLDGMHLFKAKNASLQKLIAACVGPGLGRQVFAVIGGAINRALLNFEESTAIFMKKHQLPGYMSLPSFLGFDGQLLRKQMERKFHTHILDHWAELQGMGIQELTCSFNQLGKRMQEGNKVGGYTVEISQLLTPSDARAKKRAFSVARCNGLKPSQDILSIREPAKKRQNTVMAAFTKNGVHAQSSRSIKVMGTG